MEKEISLTLSSSDSTTSIVAFIESVVSVKRAARSTSFNQLSTFTLSPGHIAGLDSILKNHSNLTLTFEDRKSFFCAAFRDSDTKEILGQLNF